jgi:uncharacterized membrane protein YagU involved in acid resistance
MSPLGALLAGIAAGLVGTIALSVLSRVLPVMPGPRHSDEDPNVPGAGGYMARATPAQALTETQSPGPEGLAQQFAFKVGAGLFGIDISGSSRAWGLLTHLIYGSAWGALLGLLLASFRVPAILFGLVYGLLVWLVGPGLLVPAMRLMPPLRAQGAHRIAVLVAAHLVWGVLVAVSFQYLQRRFG